MEVWLVLFFIILLVLFMDIENRQFVDTICLCISKKKVTGNLSKIVNNIKFIAGIIIGWLKYVERL